MNLRYLAYAFAGWLASAADLLAQSEAASDAPASKVGIFEAIGSGGPIGFTIIGVSVVAGTLIVEHFMSIKRDKLAPPEAIDEIEELLQEGNYQEVLEYCEAEPTFFTNVVAAGVRKLGYPYAAVEKSIEEMEDEESVKLHQKIGWLSLISSVAPMMGLFGTVVGMVGAFGVIATEASPEPRMFAGAIQLALITTVLGLTVAIPVTAFYTFFRNRVTMLSIEIGAMVEEMFERFRTGE
ncbi:MAG: MotA/TolQ/ExbB proton channel family protein [Planctomycetes bacterium]|nr:MotA/TolQ/ExbB proton channel family protein [Planctomycetota bacterium]MBL7008980.1 MotA/TolQ/ExbB proton channel family protein [Planctomycetota bacterium]